VLITIEVITTAKIVAILDIIIATLTQFIIVSIAISNDWNYGIEKSIRDVENAVV
jgi:hypothetical protein